MTAPGRKRPFAEGWKPGIRKLFSFEPEMALSMAASDPLRSFKCAYLNRDNTVLTVNWEHSE